MVIEALRQRVLLTEALHQTALPPEARIDHLHPHVHPMEARIDRLHQPANLVGAQDLNELQHRTFHQGQVPVQWEVVVREVVEGIAEVAEADSEEEVVAVEEDDNLAGFQKYLG